MFLISNPAMVIACCENGIIGSVPALNQRTSDGFESWIIEINAALDALKQEHPDKVIAPYAVNLIVNPVNTRLEADLKLCIKHKVPIIITSLGINPDLIKAVHGYGGIILHDITTLRHAHKAADAGVDGLIAVSAGAGGHAGTLNPFALIGEIRQFFGGILALAGCLSTGRDVLAAHVMGADFAYMGTRFISTREAAATQDYKDLITTAQASDIIYTDAVSGVPANFLRQSLEKAGFDLKDLKNGTARKGELAGLDDEAKAWKNIWSAGQGVGVIEKEHSIKELIAQLRKEHEHAAHAIKT